MWKCVDGKCPRMSCPYWRDITEEDFRQVKDVFSRKRHLWVNYADINVEPQL